ncbi:flagellin lysine-N-methylase [Cohnella thailandensis]|uniref:Flagellin lysine-N-methylase n=1 Tax=Cohnella thailandensis TaxID=557557 RepID=A0A841SJ67_9BACL|nr:flagellin lysine-N-methylase [Cohnella thailandensis]MBB6632563.1 flagellin lysine-N-methylase [Cohnella thailandensis]MBP1971857.1 lysine-N-methylase [Cohnella thailandensis]
MSTGETALMPDYMRDFKCIGSACEDTCCAGWRVSVDKDTFEKYKRVDHPELSKKFATELIETPLDQRKPHDYARMNINSTTGNCGFLDGGLCSIQAAIGEDYLSGTCATYPRVVNMVNGVQEVSTELSCPEAARVVLLNPKGIQFSYEPKLTWRNVQISSKFATQNTSNPLANSFWEIRIAAIRLLQDRRFSLEHRFMRLAVLADQVEDYLTQNKASNAAGYIANVMASLERGSELDLEASFPADPQFQLKLTNRILLNILEKKLWHNRRYGDCLNDYIAGMQEVNGADMAQFTEYFGKVEKQYYRPFIEEYEYLFENYLVNYIYSTAFPLTNNRGFFENTSYLGIIYSLLRTQLIGMAAHHGGINAELAVKLVQSFTKNFEHIHGFRKMVLDICEEEQVNALGPLSLVVMVHSK